MDIYPYFNVIESLKKSLLCQPPSLVRCCKWKRTSGSSRSGESRIENMLLRNLAEVKSKRGVGARSKPANLNSSFTTYPRKMIDLFTCLCLCHPEILIVARPSRVPSYTSESSKASGSMFESSPSDSEQSRSGRNRSSLNP